MNTKEIVKAWLEAHGYDGLYNTDFNCSCPLVDLKPCKYFYEGCKAGKKLLRTDGDWIIEPE